MKIEINQLSVIAALVILAFDGVVFAIMFYTLGRSWRRHEDARKTAGITAVLLLAFVGIPFGLVDLMSWLFFSLLFAVAGGVATSLKITEQVRTRKQWEEERANGGRG